MDLGAGPAPAALGAAGPMGWEAPPRSDLPAVWALHELDAHLSADPCEAARIDGFSECGLATGLQCGSSNVDPDASIDSLYRRLDHDAVAHLGPQKLSWSG